MEPITIVLIVLFAIPVLFNFKFTKISKKKDDLPATPISEMIPEFTSELPASNRIRRVGVFRDNITPGKDVEHLCKSDFTFRRFVPGKYGGNKLGYDDVIYVCPKCRTNHIISFQHGDTWKCECGLIAQSHGNGLDVWE